MHINTKIAKTLHFVLQCSNSDCVTPNWAYSLGRPAYAVKNKNKTFTLYKINH